MKNIRARLEKRSTTMKVKFGYAAIFLAFVLGAELTKFLPTLQIPKATLPQGITQSIMTVVNLATPSTLLSKALGQAGEMVGSIIELFIMLIGLRPILGFISTTADMMDAIGERAHGKVMQAFGLTIASVVIAFTYHLLNNALSSIVGLTIVQFGYIVGLISIVFSLRGLRH
jgi:hypothetical protein